MHINKQDALEPLQECHLLSLHHRVCGWSLGSSQAQGSVRKSNKVRTQHPTQNKASGTSSYRSDKNLQIPGMSQLTCYLRVCQQVLQKDLLDFFSISEAERL